MSWRGNRDLLFWYYVACTIFCAFVALFVEGVYHILTTQQVR